MRRRLWRAGIILCGGWLVLETALVQLVAARIGWGATLALLSIKGGIGLVLVGFLAVRAFIVMKSRSDGVVGSASLRAAFGVASGILITLPGFVPSILGIALFTPSVQRAILARFQRKSPQESPREIDLGVHDWREIRRKKLSTRRRARKTIA